MACYKRCNLRSLFINFCFPFSCFVTSDSIVDDEGVSVINYGEDCLCLVLCVYIRMKVGVFLFVFVFLTQLGKGLEMK